MKYAGISWEGGLVGPETIEKLSDENAIKGQKNADFGIKGKVKDEILIAWADAKNQWKVFRARQEREDAKDKYGTTRTRQFWLQPLLALLGYDLENAPAVELAGKSFAISHRAQGRICPVHIVGWTESLDKKRDNAHFSPHSLVQEYLNLDEGTLFALVSNGLVLRLLRDSSRLVKLSYLEFNLELIFEDELYDNFAILYRLLHSSRWPQSGADASLCLLELYHQDSLENGERIRDKLSVAVKDAMCLWADGFLIHPDNSQFRDDFKAGRLTASVLYEELLTLVYRVLFLLVIEERSLVHPAGTDSKMVDLYMSYYSLQSLRERCRSVRREEGRHYDMWEAVKACFALHEDSATAVILSLKPLAGDLFSSDTLLNIRNLHIDNYSFSRALSLLDSYYDEKRGVSVRVNYAALNVEEFGSVYEGLLDLDATVSNTSGLWRFGFTKGNARGNSGSHYTPEELVQPLIQHALDPLLEKVLKEADPEQGLLKLKICDDACGSGHILLNAARRIALELARVRTKADNPDPVSYRKALREVIERCIYGVDSNPQAVRLCKVALWLESHNPGTSLGFLDNHIKCGDSLVGLTSPSDLLEGIPESAFAQCEGDDKDWGSELRKRHKKEQTVSEIDQIRLNWRSDVGENLNSVIETLKAISAMDDTTSVSAALKKQSYLHATQGSAWLRLKALADIKLSPFFIPKRQGEEIATEAIYRAFLNGTEDMESHPVALQAETVARDKHFFHWFLEFAEVMQDGGFDCFLGNPPFLGGKKLSGTFGKDYLEYMKYAYSPAGSIDLVGYFVRRNFNLLKDSRSLGTLSTNTLAQGGTREGSLAVIEKQGGILVMAVRSRPWPGAAAVEVSQAVIHKGPWAGRKELDGKSVSFISTYFDDQDSIGNPFPLAVNADKSFIGSYVLGMGFVMDPSDAAALIVKNPKNKDVLFPYLNGDDLNSRSDQSPSRWVINFQDWPLDHATAPSGYNGPVAADYPDCLDIVERLVKPDRDKLGKGDSSARGYAAKWWLFGRPCLTLYRTIAPLERVVGVPLVAKYQCFIFTPTNIVFMHKLAVITTDSNFLYSILNSIFHYYWAWKYSSTLGGATLNYSPSDIFETFPFPPGLEPSLSEPSSSHAALLDSLGGRLDVGRREVMGRLDIGLTKLYNLYHDPELSPELVVKTAKCPDADALWAVAKIETLRTLHADIDTAVRDAYGWNEQDLPLGHGFHELEFLPENDRTRYTVCPRARREILRLLLELNHARHAEEVAAGLVDTTGKVIKKKAEAKKKGKTADVGQGEMF